MYVNSEEALRKLYGFPKGRAVQKQLSALEKHTINFIGHSPFFTLSTYNRDGFVDCSPRGGKAGFVKVVDEHHLLIPDSKGNNRLDSLINIIETGNVGCLFLIPGIDETLRINGTARITTNTDYLSLFREEKNPPKTCLEVEITEVFLHCAKALMRSALWDSDAQIQRPDFPTMGQMINDQIGENDTPESQVEMVARYQKDL
ncbi:pyridoxamine 5'-phosphate oxidase family protein [Marinomonas agarivorans]|nr:pyridoxamine 5'-phosphate oxidase family protein [Marinomonas agarivorans]